MQCRAERSRPPALLKPSLPGTEAPLRRLQCRGLEVGGTDLGGAAGCSLEPCPEGVLSPDYRRYPRRFLFGATPTAAKPADLRRQHPSSLGPPVRDVVTRHVPTSSSPTLSYAPHAPGAVRSQLHPPNRRCCPLPPALGLPKRASKQTPGSVCPSFTNAPRPGEPFSFPGGAGAERGGEDEASVPSFPPGPAASGRGRLDSFVAAVLSRSCQPCQCRCGCPCFWEGRKEGKGRKGRTHD